MFSFLSSFVRYYIIFVQGTVRIWHANTYRLESTLNYGMDRAWSMSSMKASNNVAIGYDEGSIMVKVTGINTNYFQQTSLSQIRCHM